MTHAGPDSEASVETPPRGIPTGTTPPPPPPPPPAAPQPSFGPPQPSFGAPAAPKAPDLSFLKAPAITAGLTYLAVLVIAFIASLFLGGMVKETLTDNVGDANGIAGRLPFLLTGMALFGKVTAGASAGSDMASGQANAALFAVPLTLTLVALAVSAFVTARQGQGANVKTRWRNAASTGALLGVIAAILAAVTRWTWEGAYSGFGASVTVQVSALGVFLGATAVGTLGAALGSAIVANRLDLSRIGIRVPGSVRHVANTAGITGALVAAVATVLGTIVALVKVGFLGTVGALMTVGPNALLWVTAVSGLGSISAADGGSGEALNLVHLGGWAWLLLALPVLTALAAAVRGYLAAGRRPWRDAWITPAVFASVAALALAATHISVNASLGALMYSNNSTATITITGVSILIAAAWGLAFEAAERHVAPYVVALCPAVVTLNSKLPWTTTSPAALTSLPAVHQNGEPAKTGETEGAPAFTPVTIDRRKAARVAIILGVAVAAVGALAGAKAVVANTMFSPANPVEEYVAALEDGRVSDAFAVTDPDVPNAQRTLLTDAVYGKVEGRTSNGKVTSTEVHDDFAYVTVSSDQDGAKTSVTYTVRKDGKAWLVFDKWALEHTAIPQVDVSEHLAIQEGGIYTVNGIEIAAVERQASFFALPGRYTISLADQPLFTHDEFTIMVSGNGTATLEGKQNVTLSYELTDEARTKAAELSGDYITECLGGLDSFDGLEDCGVSIYVSSWKKDDARDITWTLDGAPDYSVTVTDDAKLKVSVSGKANVSATVVANEEHYRSADESLADWSSFNYSLVFPIEDGTLGKPTKSGYGW